MDATFVRMAYHEMIRIISPLDAELINLERELADTPGAGSESRGRVVRAQRRVRLMTEFLDNLRAFTTEVRGPCQRRSKISPPGRSKTSPLDVMRYAVLGGCPGSP